MGKLRKQVDKKKTLSKISSGADKNSSKTSVKTSGKNSGKSKELLQLTVKNAQKDLEWRGKTAVKMLRKVESGGEKQVRELPHF